MRNIRIRNVRKLIRMYEKIIGLMFSNEINNRLFFVFDEEIKQPFHSFFCPKFDIVFLNKDNIVNEFYEIRKWKVIKPKMKYKYVLEAEPGFIKKYKIKNGDKLKI